MIAEVEKIKIIAPVEFKEKVLNILAQLKCADFSTTTILNGNKNNHLINTLLVIAEFINKTQSLNNRSEIIKTNKLNLSALTANYHKYLELTKALEQTTREVEQLEKFKTIDFSQKDLPYLKYFDYCFILIKNPFREKILNEFKKFGQYQKILDKNEEFLYLVIFKKDKRQNLEQINKNYQLKEWQIPLKSPRRQYAGLKKKAVQIKTQLKKIEDYFLSVSQLDLIKKIEELRFIEEKKAIIAGSKNSYHFVFFEGYVLKEKLDTVKKLLEEQIKYFYISQEPFKAEEAPIYLENKKLVKPYELITNLFGLPHYKETDPTPFLMPFFTIYFGFTLSEAGYGLIMCLVGLVLLAVKKLKTIAILLILCGLSAIIFGFILGSLFGLNIGKIDPQTNPLYVLKIALSLGMIHLALSYLMKTVNSFKNKNYSEGLRDGLIWSIILLIFSCWLVLTQLLGITPFGIGLFNKIMAFLILFLIIIYIITTPNKFMGFLKGIASLYSFVGIFSDVLSYSRLLALGLATGVIAATINLLASLLKDMVPLFPVNYMVFILVLIFGHAFNLVINLLGSFIHSSRLQFVESFSKFFEGGGKKFVPLVKP